MSLKSVLKLIGSVKITSILDRLFPHVKDSFIKAFTRTQVEYGFEHNKPNPIVLKDLKDRTIILSKKSQDALHGDLSFQLTEGLQNGESITQLTTRLKKIFDMSRKKVEVIARNEIIISQKVGTLEAYDKAGVWGRKWMTHKDKRTCKHCLALDGQICKNGEWFKHPETGEDLIHDMCHIQCRCTTLAVFKKPADYED